MVIESDWHDYLEPEVDGPETLCIFICSKCGFREVVPEAGNLVRSCSTPVVCRKCKSKMYEDAGY